MFERLENELEQLKIQHFGVSSTELEEVFLKVGSDHKSSNKELTQNGKTKDIEASETELLSGFRLHMNHWYAMLKKRYYCWKNSWILFLVQIIVLIFFTAISVTFARESSHNSNTLQERKLSLSTYKKGTVTICPQYTKNATINRIIDQYHNEISMSSTEDSKHNWTEFGEEGIQEKFLHFGDSIKIRTNARYLAGLSFDSNSIVNDSIFIAWFNGQLFHSAPLSLNLVHNAILKYKFGQNYSIQVTNWPIPFRPESKVMLTMNGNDLGSQLAMYISFAMAFIIALYIMFHIRERSSKAKLLQFISGVDASTFWVTSFLFDFVVYGLVSMVFYFTIFAMRQKYWSTEEELRPLFPIFGLFGLSSLAITYVVSVLFSNASYGFVSLASIFVFTGTTFFKLITILLSPILNKYEIANQLKRVFLMFPHFSLGDSLYNLNKYRVCKEVCDIKTQEMKNFTSPGASYNIEMKVNTTEMSKYNTTCNTDAYCTDCDMGIYGWKEPGIGRNLTYMAITAIIFFIILWIIEKRVISRLNHYFRRHGPQPPSALITNAIDCDVINEKNKVNTMTPNDLRNHNLVLQNLTKSYGDFLAVKGISVAVKVAECFGLLGVNGAGKTTTFKMMTGDTSISSGDVFLSGLSLKTQLAEVQKLIGYCPQFDALLDNLTGTQTLEIFGLLRGYRRKDISAMSARLAESLNFTKHIDKEIKSYSGGNKRKLSTAIALMGNPAVAYLDEPSSGMDIGAKRNLWDVVSQVRNSGTSIVLTSHSMEECEALCNRIAIMVNGEFKCLGSAQHLKNQFSKGFLLTIKLQSNGTNAKVTKADAKIAQNRISEVIRRNYPGAHLKEQYQGLLTFYVPQTNELKWSSMFDHMESIKGILGIEDYSISQSSLEQVFLSFTKPYQDDEQSPSDSD
ncbi:ATP-binding cassette sub-family A member 3-like [Contarinia nasturtii]|uniref:ATP-binding cassette sub-family A member 3-like n=1 Tax=Contarinia nasturtii TaxID=265458 RepID=UPI0012D3944F|nr:ATP-binding cassette sub-family A member 3-like [Contarinia nasturtii]